MFLRFSGEIFSGAMSSASASVIDANRQLLKKLLLVAVMMFGVGYAMVPFYEQMCRIAGIRDVFRSDQPALSNTQIDLKRNVSIELIRIRSAWPGHFAHLIAI